MYECLVPILATTFTLHYITRQSSLSLSVLQSSTFVHILAKLHKFYTCLILAPSDIIFFTLPHFFSINHCAHFAAFLSHSFHNHLQILLVFCDCSHVISKSRVAHSYLFIAAAIASSLSGLVNTICSNMMNNVGDRMHLCETRAIILNQSVKSEPS